MDASLTDYIDALDEIFAETEILVRSLGEADGVLPTDCPGWTVKDQLSHMIGLEVALASGVEPGVDVPDLAHVVNDFDRYMESHVEARRSHTLAGVVDELAELRATRIDQLRELAGVGDEPVMPGPMGSEQPMAAGLPVRVFDLWIHEQDIRRAVRRPTRDQPLATDLFLDRLWGAWPTLLPKRAAAGLPPLDLAVRLEARDRPERPALDIVLGDGADALTIVGSAVALVRVGSGRGRVEARLADLQIEGDRGQAASVVVIGAVTP